MWYSDFMKPTKNISMRQAAALLEPGARTLAIGGNSLHRVPHAFIKELVRLRRSELKLHIVKTAGAWDIDLLCLAGMVTDVSAGFVGYETRFGLARHYRRAVESGEVNACEHACYTVIAALRAASYGLGFLPVRGLDGSDLVEARSFRRITDPYDEAGSAVAIPAIVPDMAVIHVQYADRRGNGVIIGSKNEDVIMARAAGKVLLTAEHLVETENLPVPLDHVDIPSVLVHAVVHAPNGAAPGSCCGEYEIDESGVTALVEAAGNSALTDLLGGAS